MNSKAKELIVYTTVLITGIVVLFYGLIKADVFLIPFTIAALLAMILLPVERKLTDWGVTKGWAVLLSDLLLLIFFAGTFLIVGSQIQNIMEDWPTYKEKLEPRIEKVQQYVYEKTGLSEQEQQEEVKQAINSEGTTNSAKILSEVTTLAGNFLLVFVYIFFFMYYRQKFKNSILKFIPEEKRGKASQILSNFSKVSQQYLFGRFLLILFLCVIYSLGLSIVGIKHAILISIISALLTLIPYLGNVIGVFLALAMSLLSGGTLVSMLGVIAVFSVVQFVESYILEPYIVGHKVELNPVLTLIGVLVGGYVWGIAGMIIAIPVMGMFKVIFDRIPLLNPLGYILDESDVGSGEGLLVRIKNRLVSKFKR